MEEIANDRAPISRGRNLLAAYDHDAKVHASCDGQRRNDPLAP